MSTVTHNASRIILAPPRAVFRAFIDPEALVNWLPPAGMTAELQNFDPRPGGGYHMILTYSDPSAGPGKSTAATDRVTVRFVELDPDARIVEAVDFESDDPAFGGTMTLIITMAAVTGGTKVTFVAENVPAGISEQDHRSGMESSLKNLANLLDQTLGQLRLSPISRLCSLAFQSCSAPRISSSVAVDALTSRMLT